MQYSCAYFRDPENETLEQAQRNKLIHATTKLQLKPGMTVAEIGSGWGGFAIHLARETGAHVTAINVSPEQLKVSRERATRRASPTGSNSASSTIATCKASSTGWSRSG